MAPGAFFITVGQTLSSPHFELVDQILLPANGRGKYGGASEDHDEPQDQQAGHHDAVNDEADADVGEDIRLRKAGLYDFFVYQRLADAGAELKVVYMDPPQRAVSDTEVQRILRGHDDAGEIAGGGGLAALCVMLATETCTDQARTSCALALHSSMVCEPSLRAAADAGIVDASLSLVEEGKGVLGVCGILLLSAVASHSYGARSVMRVVSNDRLRSALEGVLEPSAVSPAPVVAAAIEVLLYLANTGHEGLSFVEDSVDLRSRMRDLASGGDDRAHLVEQTVTTLLAEREGRRSDGSDRTALVMLDMLGGSSQGGENGLCDVDESDAEMLDDAVTFLEMAAEEGNR
jgi:hypothetical protein